MAGTDDKRTGGGEFWRSLVSGGIYKRQQGRIARQTTFAVFAITLSIGVWRLSQLLPLWISEGSSLSQGASSVDLGFVRFLVPGLLLAVGLWICFRIVNYPKFTDFLISVETEMTKVTWPSRDEVFRSSVVVIFMIFALSAILAAYDLFWWLVLRSLQGFG